MNNASISSLRDMVRFSATKHFQQNLEKYSYDKLAEGKERVASQAAQTDVFAQAEQAAARLEATDAALSAYPVAGLEPTCARLSLHVPQLPQRLASSRRENKPVGARAILFLDSQERAALTTAREAMQPEARRQFDDNFLHAISPATRARGEALDFYNNSVQAWMAAQLLANHPQLKTVAQSLTANMRAVALTQRTARLAHRRMASKPDVERSQENALNAGTKALLSHPYVFDSLAALYERTFELPGTLVTIDTDSLLDKLEIEPAQRVQVLQEASVLGMKQAALTLSLMPKKVLPASALRLEDPAAVADRLQAALDNAQAAAHKSDPMRKLRDVICDLRVLERDSRADDLFWAQVEFLCNHQGRVVALTQMGDALVRALAQQAAKPLYVKKTRRKAKASPASNNTTPQIGLKPQTELQPQAPASPQLDYAAAALRGHSFAPVQPAPASGSKPVIMREGLPTRLGHTAMMTLVRGAIDPANHPSALASAVYHFNKHAAANPHSTIESYIAEARAARAAWKQRQMMCWRLSEPSQRAKLVDNHDVFLVFTNERLEEDEKIISYRNRATMGR